MIPSVRAIRVLSDGRPGHENQSAGLAAAVSRLSGARVEIIHITGDGYFARYRYAITLANGLAKPELIIATGHATHLPLKFAAWHFVAKSVVIMQPTWPKSWFDLCLVPAHDGYEPCKGSNVVTTRGALNRIPEELPPKLAQGMILIGGPSKHHDWNGAAMADAICDVVASRPDLDWTVADSRRTPSDFFSILTARGVNAELVPHTKTKPDWLPSTLLQASEVWVTADSISMMHEAVTAGARTGILPTPALRQTGRVYGAVEHLVTNGYAMKYADWLSRGKKLAPPKQLHETARCAAIVLERFFPAGTTT
jgi:mitochondrial fission protein ELM1